MLGCSHHGIRRITMCKAECVFIFRFAISPPRYPRYRRHVTRDIAARLPAISPPRYPRYRRHATRDIAATALPAISPPGYPRYRRHRGTRGIADTLPVTMTPLKTIFGAQMVSVSEYTLCDRQSSYRIRAVKMYENRRQMAGCATGFVWL